MPYSRIFYLYEDGKYYVFRKPDSALGKPKTIRRLLQTLPRADGEEASMR